MHLFWHSQNFISEVDASKTGEGGGCYDCCDDGTERRHWLEGNEVPFSVKLEKPCLHPISKFCLS